MAEVKEPEIYVSVHYHRFPTINTNQQSQQATVII